MAISNEQTFKDFIVEKQKEYKAEAMTIEWTVWMLNQLEVAKAVGAQINPAWLRASHTMGPGPIKEPPMFYECN